MVMPTIETSVGEWVAARPSRSRVFQRLGIDFCCGGKLSLAEACRRHGLDVAQTLDVLLREHTPIDEPDPASMPLATLCDHIEERHHRAMRAELPRLLALAQKVASVHGDRHPWLGELELLLARFATELDVHMMTEEVILFPAIRRLDMSGARTGMELATPMRVMEQEHETAGHALSRLRELTSDFTPPADACTSFRALLAGLRELDEDMQVHVHKENNVLFPRVLSLIAEEGRSRTSTD